MQKKVKLITGANGEIGQALIKQLDSEDIITLDIISTNNKIHKHFVGSILDQAILDQINTKYEIVEIYHLAAILSTKAEKNPELAKEVNITGTTNLLKICFKQFSKYGQIIPFFFPSSIAVYNTLNDNFNALVNEKEYCNSPYTVYGQSKLVCERAGIKKDSLNQGVDFRCIRFPGIISATSLPTGGTSDYASEMIHYAALNKTYPCFVNCKTTLPFVIMPDAISAIIKLMETPKKQIKSKTYNITSFSPSVEQFKNKLIEFFPNFILEYNINNDRQKIVDSWPSKIDDSLSSTEWNWESKYNFNDSFENYIIPNILKYYSKKEIV